MSGVNSWAGKLERERQSQIQLGDRGGSEHPKMQVSLRSGATVTYGAGASFHGDGSLQSNLGRPSHGFHMRRATGGQHWGCSIIQKEVQHSGFLTGASVWLNGHPVLRERGTHVYFKEDAAFSFTSVSLPW